MTNTNTIRDSLFLSIPDRATLNSKGADWSAAAVGGLEAFFERFEQTPEDAPVRMRAEHAGGGRPCVMTEIETTRNERATRA